MCPRRCRRSLRTAGSCPSSAGPTIHGDTSPNALMSAAAAWRDSILPTAATSRQSARCQPPPSSPRPCGSPSASAIHTAPDAGWHHSRDECWYAAHSWAGTPPRRACSAVLAATPDPAVSKAAPAMSANSAAAAANHGPPAADDPPDAPSRPNAAQRDLGVGGRALPISFDAFFALIAPAPRPFRGLRLSPVPVSVSVPVRVPVSVSDGWSPLAFRCSRGLLWGSLSPLWRSVLACSLAAVGCSPGWGAGPPSAPRSAVARSVCCVRGAACSLRGRAWASWAPRRPVPGRSGCAAVGGPLSAAGRCRGWSAASLPDARRVAPLVRRWASAASADTAPVATAVARTRRDGVHGELVGARLGVVGARRDGLSDVFALRLGELVEGVLAGQLALRGHELVASAVAVGGLFHPVGHRGLLGLAHLVGVARRQSLLGVAAGVDPLAQRGEPSGRAGSREPRAAAGFGLGSDRRQPAPRLVPRRRLRRPSPPRLRRPIRWRGPWWRRGGPPGRAAARRAGARRGSRGEQARGCAPRAGQRGPAPAPAAGAAAC